MDDVGFGTTEWDSAFEADGSQWVTYDEFWEYFTAIDVSIPPLGSNLFLPSLGLGGCCGPCGVGMVGMFRHCCDGDGDESYDDPELLQPVPQSITLAQHDQLKYLYLAEEVLL